MNLSSYRVQRALGLPPPRTRNLTIERDIRVPMPDGVSLLADRWYPRDAVGPLPTVLIRSPYGRRGMEGAMNARPLAERGFQVLLQSCRGTFGSGGVFDPMRCEREDGLATLEWLVKQPWAGGCGRAVRQQLPGVRPVGRGRPPAARGRGDDPARDRVGADAGFPAR